VAIRLWVPQGIANEYTYIAVGDKIVEVPFYPYRMYFLDVYNQGPNSVKVMINDQSLPNASTISSGDGRRFDAKSPKFAKIGLYAGSGKTATVVINTMR
jgi:hypothetical protein